jgi:hypothetical protein
MRALFDRRFLVFVVAALAVAALFTAIGVGELLAGTVADELGTAGSTEDVGAAERLTTEPLPLGGDRPSAAGAAILGRNLFDSAIGPLAGSGPQGEGVPDRRTEPDEDRTAAAIGPCTGGRLKVLATLSSRLDRASSFALLEADGKQSRHREGDEVAGLRVEEIGWRFVLLSNRERELCRLDLH